MRPGAAAGLNIGRRWRQYGRDAWREERDMRRARATSAVCRRARGKVPCLVVQKCGGLALKLVTRVVAVLAVGGVAGSVHAIHGHTTERKLECGGDGRTTICCVTPELPVVYKKSRYCGFRSYRTGVCACASGVTGDMCRRRGVGAEQQEGYHRGIRRSCRRGAEEGMHAGAGGIVRHVTPQSWQTMGRMGSSLSLPV
jgi:hypothetical protein